MPDYITQFSNAIGAVGLTIPDSIEADGRLHRFSANGKPADDSGWYVLHGDGLPAGAFGCWRSGVSQTWRAEIGRKLTPTENAAHRERVKAMRREREADAERRHLAAREAADRTWKVATPAGNLHPYLTAKGIKAHRVRFHNGALVIPMKDVAGVTQSLQFIGADGEKLFLPGGQVTGCYYAIGKPGSVLVVAEGFATAATIHEATGITVACAFTAGNLEAVARALHEKYPDMRMIIAGDNDISGTGQRAAAEAARAVGGTVAMPNEAGKDWNDVRRERGAEVVKAAIEDSVKEKSDAHDDRAVEERASSAATTSMVDAAEIARVAALSAVEYDRQRAGVAEQLGCRSSTLDAEVKRWRDENAPAEDAASIEDVEPWPQSVAGEELLDELAGSAGRFIVLPRHADTALALWVVFSHAIDAADVAPLLALVSPVKRCGKSTVLAWLKALTRRPLPASNITGAALFRCVEAWRPTLLIDEADTFAGDNDELRGVLNSGHTRSGAFVIRTVGDNHEPRRFTTWGAKAIALIGKLPGTLHDRSVVIEMRRKMPSERVEKLRDAESHHFEELARKCARWAIDNAPALRGARPKLPDQLNDRAADNWDPLAAIADAAGGPWPKRVREAAIALSGDADAPDSAGVELLRDIRACFGELSRDRASSAELVEKLAQNPEGRWAGYNKGKPISQRQVARLLAPFGIASQGVRLPDGSTPKGYLLNAFKDVFARYLSDSDPQQCNKTRDSTSYGDLSSATPTSPLRTESNGKELIPNGCCGVADDKPLKPEGEDGEVL